MQDEGIPPAPQEVVAAVDASQPSLEQVASAKDGPEVDMPQTPAAIAPGSEKKKVVAAGEKKKRKRSVNPAHFRPAKKTKRNFWTQEEVDALLKGVEKIGPGKWTKIKGEYPEIFANRTSLDLKDKWRNIERRPDTNKIAKVSRAKKQAEAEAKGGSGSDGLEPLILTVECEDNGADGEKSADNVTAATSQTNDLYGWAISKFYTDLTKADIKKISLLTQEGGLIPYGKSLKAANLVNNTKLNVVKKSHADVKKDRNTAEV